MAMERSWMGAHSIPPSKQERIGRPSVLAGWNLPGDNRDDYVGHRVSNSAARPSSRQLLMDRDHASRKASISSTGPSQQDLDCLSQVRLDTIWPVLGSGRRRRSHSNRGLKFFPPRKRCRIRPARADWARSAYRHQGRGADATPPDEAPPYETMKTPPVEPPREFGRNEKTTCSTITIQAQRS